MDYHRMAGNDRKHVARNENPSYGSFVNLHTRNGNPSYGSFVNLHVTYNYLCL